MAKNLTCSISQFPCNIERENATDPNPNPTLNPLQIGNSHSGSEVAQCVSCPTVTRTLSEMADLPTCKILAFHPELQWEQQYKMQKYLALLDSNGVVTVKYHSKTGGRFYADKGLSLQMLKSNVRHTLSHVHSLNQPESCMYHDIDIVNAHPTLLLHLCKKNGWPSTYLELYVSGREIYLMDVVVMCHMPRESAKNLFIQIIYGGSASWWQQQNGVSALPAFVTHFESEMQAVMNLAWTANGDYQAIVASKKNPKASLLSLKLQEMELIVLDALEQYLRLNDWKIGVYVFDGLMVFKRSDCDLSHALLRECETFALQHTGLKVSILTKPMDNLIQLNAFSTLHHDFAKLVTYTRQSGRYIKDDLSSFLDPNVWKWMLIKSPTGTGKTLFLKSLLEKVIPMIELRNASESEPNPVAPLIVAMSPRRSVTHQHFKTFKELGFEMYTCADMTKCNRSLPHWTLLSR